MKALIYIIFIIFNFNVVAKECTFTRTNSAGESKYTEQYSIKTNIN